MDDAHFLRAVCEVPLDDGPRLVYADALDERGDVRGEFIRAQCELARLEFYAACLETCTPPHFEGCPNRMLRRREWKLLGAHYLEWVDPVMRAMGFDVDVPGDPVIVPQYFRRGFVAAVTLTAAQFFGGPCGRCGGEGRLTTDTGGNVWHSVCPACRSTGRVDGVAAALFAQAPVTEVRLSDREPDSGSDGRRAWWYTDPDWCLPGARRHWLPVELRPHLTGSICEPIDWPRSGICGFDYGNLMGENDGVELARADCSAACVALGRARANLPALARPASANFFRQLRRQP